MTTTSNDLGIPEAYEISRQDARDAKKIEK